MISQAKYCGHKNIWMPGRRNGCPLQSPFNWVVCPCFSPLGRQRGLLPTLLRSWQCCCHRSNCDYFPHTLCGFGLQPLAFQEPVTRKRRFSEQSSDIQARYQIVGKKVENSHFLFHKVFFMLTWKTECIVKI